MALTERLHAIEGVDKLQGNYPLVGRAVKEYGYDTVLRAIEDLEFEAVGRKRLNVSPWSNAELRRAFFARCKWNHRPSMRGPKTQGGRTTGKDPNLDDLFELGPDGRLIAHYGGVPKGVRIVGSTMYTASRRGGDELLDAG
ncbi:MAG: hypothetical protein NUW23_08790 [Firmicutes bacterium]|nr:hypothetical protein [Bacillota bacterium]